LSSVFSERLDAVLNDVARTEPTDFQPHGDARALLRVDFLVSQIFADLAVPRVSTRDYLGSTHKARGIVEFGVHPERDVVVRPVATMSLSPK